MTGRSYLVALEWASELFEGETRKGKPDVPYLSHLVSVSALVMQDGGSEAEIVAGLLHDAMEDKHISQSAIATKLGGDLGTEVARIVLGCSDGIDEHGNDVDDEGNVVSGRGKDTWEARKTQYLEHLEDADVSILRVSAADKLDNARDLVADLHAHGPEALREFNVPPDAQLWWYGSLADTFTRRLPNSSLTQRLDTNVSDICRLIELPATMKAWEADDKQRRAP